MTILPILVAPDPILNRIAEPVTAVDDDIRQLMTDMLETMYDAPGIGLAAPQVGVLKRVIVADVSNDPEARRPIVMANPKVVRTSPDLSMREEGCLSVPDYYEEVERPERARIRYLDDNNEPQEEEFEGVLATCLQHEIDHLDGKLFIDYLSRLKRSIILKKLAKAKKKQS